MTLVPEAQAWRALVPCTWEPPRPSDGIPTMFPELQVGDRVRARKGSAEGWREGVVSLQWFGLEETVDVDHDDGTTASYFPCCGMRDEVEVRVWPPSREP